MPQLLFDHPWPVEAEFDAASDGFEQLLKFVALVRDTKLSPVRFMDPLVWSEAIPQFKPHHSAKAAVRRFVEQQLLRPETAPGAALAMPLSGEKASVPLHDVWRAALREAVGNDDDWRQPQIVVSEKRIKLWPDLEVKIRRDDMPDAVPLERLTVPLAYDAYCRHKYATADVNPWRSLEWIFPPASYLGGVNPCRLPRPPILRDVALEEIPLVLSQATIGDWRADGRYYFVPPTNWTPTKVKKTEWRKTGAFERDSVKTKAGVKTGPVDYKGRIWAWDEAHGGHWDVQLPGDYIRIGISGNPLD